MKRKERIERLRQAIPDFDPRFYDLDKVSHALINMEKIRKNPAKVADLVNRRLERKFDEVSYYATPQRTYGLVKVLAYVRDINEVIPEELYQISYDFTEFAIFQPDFSLSYSPVGTSARVLYPYFRCANEKRISTDREFGKSTENYLLDCCRKVKRKLGSDISDKLQAWIRRILKGRDWEKELSKEEFLIRQSEDISLEESFGFSEVDMYDMLLKKGLVKNPEYQRLVLCRWLCNRKTTSYEEAVDLAEKNLRYRQERLSELLMDNTIDSFIQNQQRLVRSAEFVRKALVEQREFVERYLK